MNALVGRNPPEALDKALRPRSVAVLGASNDVSRISGRPLHYMKRAGFGGAIYPVNNRREVVQGIKAYPTLTSVPESPDVALIALPAALVRDAVSDCVAKGVGAAIIYAAGFAEIGKRAARYRRS
jgi:acyl-CoA synthetase (NDP forming)